MANPAPSRYPSPLRYPGGKARLAPWLAERFFELGGPMAVDLWLEPFGGGAGAAIAAVRDHGVPEAWIVERNPALAAFWRVLLTDGSWLADEVEHTVPTLSLFDAARDTCAHSADVPVRDLALAAFILNRCSRSGIVSASVGPIGGREQRRYTVAERFNGPVLADRLREVGALAGRLWAFGGDGIAFVEQLPDSGIADEVFVLADPPYLGPGDRLYAEGLALDGHGRLAAALRALPGDWVCTYDADARLPAFYPDCDVFEFTIQHTAGSNSRRGREFLVAPPGLIHDRVGAPVPGGQLTSVYAARLEPQAV